MEKFNATVKNYQELWRKVASAYATMLYDVQYCQDRDLRIDQYDWYVDDILCKDLIRRPDALIKSAEKYVLERFEGKVLKKGVTAEGREYIYPEGEHELFAGGPC